MSSKLFGTTGCGAEVFAHSFSQPGPVNLLSIVEAQGASTEEGLELGLHADWPRLDFRVVLTGSMVGLIH